jgi:chromosome segregation ATPase
MKLALSFGLIAFAASPLFAGESAAKQAEGDKANLMASELASAFEPIHTRHGQPDTIILVAGSKAKKLQVLPDLEAVRYLDAEKANLAAEIVTLRKQREKEVDKQAEAIKEDVERKRADAERRIRAINNLETDRKVQFDSDEKAVRDRLAELNEQVAIRVQELKTLNLTAAVVRNDIAALRKDALSIRTELAGERTRLSGARRERAFIEDETQKKAVQLDQVNQIIGTRAGE